MKSVFLKFSVITLLCVPISACIDDSNADAICPTCNPTEGGSISFVDIKTVAEGNSPPNQTSRRIEVITTFDKYTSLMGEYGMTPPTELFYGGQLELFNPDFNTANVLLYDLGFNATENLVFDITPIDNNDYVLLNVRIIKHPEECSFDKPPSNRFKFLYLSSKKKLIFNETFEILSCA